MVYTIYLWWFVGWFIIVYPHLLVIRHYLRLRPQQTGADIGKFGEPSRALGQLWETEGRSDISASFFRHRYVYIYIKVCIGMYRYPKPHISKVWDVYRIFSWDHWPSWSESMARRIEWLLSRWPTWVAWRFQQGKRFTLINECWKTMNFIQPC